MKINSYQKKWPCSSDHMVLRAYGLGPLEHWDCRFESHSRHVYVGVVLSCAFLCG